MDTSRYLLDTHSLIWFQQNSPQIPRRAMEVIQNPDNVILFSQISLFEIAIKQKLGKLRTAGISVEQVNVFALSDGFAFLPIQNDHIYNYNQIPSLENHRDPFDRLLIATASYEKAAIITGDDKFTLYGDFVEVLW